MRRLLLLGVLSLGLAGAGCATNRQSTSATSTPKTATPELADANQIPGRNRAGGMFDNQAPSSSNPLTPNASGIPMTGFQSVQQRMNRSYGAP